MLGSRFPPRAAIVRGAAGAALVALAAVVALSLAYQVRAPVVVDIGGKQDAPFVARMYEAEGDAQQTYRWTREQSRVELEGENLAAPWVLRLRLNGFRPNRPVRVAVQVNGVVVDEFLARDGWDEYEVEGNVPAEAGSGNTTLYLVNDTFVPQDEIAGSTDSRRIGVALDSVTFVPRKSALVVGTDAYWLDLGAPPLLPPSVPVLSWAFALALLYGTARGIGLPKRAVNVGAVVAVLGLGLLVAFARPYVGYAAGYFLLLSIGLALCAAACLWLLPRFAARVGLTLAPAERAVLIGIVLLSVGLKWGGEWYPQFRSSDLLFHAHRLEFVAQGNLFFTSELPDAARRVVPYPPSLYVALAPLTALTDDYGLLLQLVNPLADALAIVALYFAARQVRAADSAVNAAPYALLASFLFAFNPVAFFVYSWGNHTNIFGQAVATILFAILLARSLDRPSRWLLALWLLVLASTAHLGVFLSLVVFLPLAALLRLLSRDGTARRDALAIFGLCAVGVVAATLLYYGEYSGALVKQTESFLADFGAGRAAGSGGVTWARVGDVGRYTAEQFGWALLAVGVLGIPVIWKQFTAAARGVWSAWVLVGLLFALVTLGASFSTRYTLWAAPALALSGAGLLAWLWERAGAARWAAYAICAFALGQTVWIWFDRVWSAYH